MDNTEPSEIIIIESDIYLPEIEKKFIEKNKSIYKRIPNIETLNSGVIPTECDPDHLIINEQTILINSSCIILNK